MPRLARSGWDRRQGTRGVRQASKAYPGRTTSPHQEHPGDCQCHCPQSLRNTPSTKHAQHAIEGRLQALGRAHDLLLQARWTSADLGKIVRAATEPFDNPDAPKFSIAGPEIQITSGAVIAIAMTLNELCTNTTKFGALSMPPATSKSRGRSMMRHSGCISLGPKKTVRWSRLPTTRSFGTRLVETLGKQLKGVVLLTYEPSGFVYRLDVPLTSLTPVATDR